MLATDALGERIVQAPSWPSSRSPRNVDQFLSPVRGTSLRIARLFLVLGLVRGDVVHANDSVWLPVRDQNPFVLGSGLPLLPQPPPPPGSWGIQATLVESNTELESLRGQAPDTLVIFGAETREARITVSYALDPDWSARISIGDVWIGVGFLDKPIQHFHSLIGAPQGYRGGRLGERPPVIRVSRGEDVLYSLSRPTQALAPLLADVTREWGSNDRHWGISLGAKLPTGDAKRLSDAGDTTFSTSIFADLTAFDNVQIGARAGYMYSTGNELLHTAARHSVPFVDIAARAPLIGRWSWVMQYDAHGALYRQVPPFLGYAGAYTIGAVRPVGDSELLIGVSEDLPLGHTQDVSFLVAWRR